VIKALVVTYGLDWDREPSIAYAAA
jgi:hypothetical protein